jgi:DNA-directed RNA polymerase specialized sigma24 family protein
MDRSLLDAIRNEDPRARKAFARWLTGELRTFYERRPHPVPIEDLIQASATEIFATLSAAPDEPTAFHNWVLERAGMRARAIHRDTHREHARLADSPPHSPAESPSVSVIRPLSDAAERQLVLEHAQRLRPIFRTAIMHVLDGGDYKSLAASEGIMEATAASRISRATVQVGQSIQADRRTRQPYRTPKFA